MPPTPRSAIFYSTIRHWGWGAPDYVWPEAARQLRELGTEVLAVVRPQICSHPRIQALCEIGVRLLPQPPLVYRRGRISEIRSRLLALTSSGRELRRFFRSTVRPHVFVDQSACFDFLDEGLLQELIRQSGATYDLFCHSNHYEAPMNDERRHAAADFMAKANRVLFNSSWIRRLAEVQLARALPNAGYFDFNVRFPHEQPLPWPEGGPIRLASVSRIDCHHKGLDMLLLGLARLPSDLPDWSMEFYGNGPDTSYLQELSASLGLTPRVHFFPAVTDVREIWRKAHMLVLVSRYEGLAVAMLEAMACGRPVLRTPYGGCLAWLVPDESGFICPAPEPVLIAETIERALRQHARWPAMGRAAHAKILTSMNPHPELSYLSAFGLTAATAAA